MEMNDRHQKQLQVTGSKISVWFCTACCMVLVVLLALGFFAVTSCWECDLDDAWKEAARPTKDFLDSRHELVSTGMSR